MCCPRHCHFLILFHRNCLWSESIAELVREDHISGRVVPAVQHVCMYSVNMTVHTDWNTPVRSSERGPVDEVLATGDCIIIIQIFISVHPRSTPEVQRQLLLTN